MAPALLKTTPLFLSSNPSKLQSRRPQIGSNLKTLATQNAAVEPLVLNADSQRVYNFAAGPATLPNNVLKKAQEELCDYQGSGMSVMEMSHRGKEFLSIYRNAESDLRNLLNIPEDYHVLFLQGGATTQFSAIPLNLCSSPQDSVDYIVTGSWGDKAFKEAKKYSSPNLVWSGKEENYIKIPSFDSLGYTPGAKYLHICANETIHGVEFKSYPNPEATLVADMSSNFCSKPVEVSRFGLIYAGAQKNVGPSGVTVVIVRKDLVGKAQGSTPVMLDYKIHAENESMYNTPPCYSIYICGLVFRDLIEQGGLEGVARRNEEKAKLIYDAIDGSGGFYRCPVEGSARSLMNVPFRIAREEKEGDFVKEATAEKMVQLKGHRSVGGIRASIYNAMPIEGVRKLVGFMKDFQARNA